MTAPLTAERHRAIVERDDGLCRRCSAAGAEVHHRRPKGMGGTSGDPHGFARVVLLCSACHRWAHSHPAAAYAGGWLIRRSSRNPDSTIPIVELSGRVLFLADDGGVVIAA